MGDGRSPEVGSIVWTDLTVDDAEEVKHLYTEVVGWKAEPVDMGGYSDFNMTLPTDRKPTAGICHARGVNADLPPQWLVYIRVDDVEKSAARCLELGGQGRYCVIQDTAGAVAALVEPAS